ncbi:MAG: type II secretion system secretin GspD [Pseudomonadota bacterium]
MRLDPHKRLVPVLLFCLWLLTAFVFPQTLTAARIASDDRTVTTVPTQKAQPRTSTAAPAQKKAASPTNAEQPVKAAPAEAPEMTAAPPQNPLPATPSLPVQTADKPVDRKAQSLPQATDQALRTPPKPTATPQPHPAVPPRDQRYVTIDFNNVDIQVFIKFISELTGRNFVIDDKVRAKVTVISPRKIAVDDVYRVFESVLDVYGFTTVQSGDVIKIIPSQQAREKSLETRLHHEKGTTDDKYVTQIVSLDHANPDEMKRVLDPLISKTSVILSYPPTGMLVITDVLSNIKRLQDIIEALDVEGVGEQISYIPLKYASATEATKSLNIIFQQRKGTFAPIKIVADDRTNALVIAATENDTIRVRELVNLMDKEIPKGTGLIRVYYLQNARAEDTAKVLTSLQQHTKTPDGKTVTLSKSVQIVADKATNSLIITAETADYLIIEDVVKKLDISRSMVYLEALIMEVNTAKNFKFGVEWQGANPVSYDGKTGSYIGGVSGDKGSYSIAQGLLAGKGLPSGLSFGVVGQMINVATVGGTVISFPNLAAFVQAYQSDSDIRILSTPQLLTLDNEEAEITVGKNVPYVTRQDTTVGSTTNYSNYEYKDVGVTLKVTPQINKEGFVRLKLDQSVTKIVTQTAESQGTSILAPTTLKRTAKTTVTVRSGDTVVIGGMIEDNSDVGTYKVPLLGDIPLLGWLFKSRSSSSERNNLFVFITPHIIQKPEDAKNIHEDKKDYMETLREGTIKATPPKKKQ